MMLAGPPEHDDLEASRVRFDLRVYPGPARNRASAAAQAAHRLPSFGSIARSAERSALSARIHEIRIDRGDRVLDAAEARGRKEVSGRFIPIVFATVSICLASLGILNGYFFLRQITAPSTAAAPSPSPSADIVGPTKGHRLQLDQAVLHEKDRAPPAKSLHGPDLFSSTAIARQGPSPAVIAPAPLAENRSTAAQPQMTSAAESAAKPQDKARLAPVPDARPTTIDGWTLREVVDGTAVLEGPGGTWRVKRGDTLPGAGRVVAIIRWGNRSIVATSKGLVSTR